MIEELVRKDFLREKLYPVPTAKRVTFVIDRVTTSKAIFQTEGDFALDKVEVGEKNRVEFLPTKQKAVERRAHMQIMREKGFDGCVIPNNLCVKCMNCSLFGAVNTEGVSVKVPVTRRNGKKREEEVTYSLKSRILYSSSYSKQSADGIIDLKTHNAVDEVSQETGQALFEVEYIKEGTVFPSVVVIRDPTVYDFIMYLKALNLSQVLGYGAKTSDFGRLKNEVKAIIFSNKFVITPLDLIQGEKIPEGDSTYLEPAELVKAVLEYELTEEEIEKWNQDVLESIISGLSRVESK
jgi:CRISPR/Cas system CSM-associated protein Csm3 (group 7 of RAMP superfamily)